MRIRTFVLADYDAVFDLWTRVGVHLSKADTFGSIMDIVEREPELFLVAESDVGRIVGVVMGTYDGAHGWIQHLAVDDEYRRQHLGTQMIEELERRFKKVGCRQLNALFLAGVPELRAFYEKLGYAYSNVALMEKTIK